MTRGLFIWAGRHRAWRPVLLNCQTIRNFLRNCLTIQNCLTIPGIVRQFTHNWRNCRAIQTISPIVAAVGGRPPNCVHNSEKNLELSRNSDSFQNSRKLSDNSELYTQFDLLSDNSELSEFSKLSDYLLNCLNFLNCQIIQ